MRDRLNILWVTPMPPSPPRFGGQARMHGLLTATAASHDVTAIALCEPAFDRAASEVAMRAYSPAARAVASPNHSEGPRKRALQLRSLLSLRSYEDIRYAVPALQAAIDEACARTRFDVVNVEFPYLMRYAFRAPGGAPPPPVVLDTHEIEYDILRQFAASQSGAFRKVYNAFNWRKLRGEERGAFRTAAGVAVCSVDDERRVQADAPGARTVVVPNGANVEYFRPRPEDPPCDGKTILFFGTFGYYPNVDGVLFFLKEIWPRIAASSADARLKIVGLRPPPEIKAFEGPRVEVAGFVEDLRPHLASAAVLIAPLRMGGGTRLKILEGMSMARPCVSTTLGAEGIEATPGRDLLLADAPDAFADAVLRLLREPDVAAEMGRAGRRLAEERYSWRAASERLVGLFRSAIEAGVRRAA